MDQRKKKILQALVNSYIESAEPVGSRTIAKKYDLGLSSATIRNELADLEEMGYIEQIHTSSGRKPSYLGYRMYVNELITLEDLSEEEREFIRKNFLNEAISEVESILKTSANILSKLTNMTAIIKAPAIPKGKVKLIQILGIEDGEILVVCVTNMGAVKNKILKFNKILNKKDFENINKVLNTYLKDVELSQIDDNLISFMKFHMGDKHELLTPILNIILDTLSENENEDLYVDGVTNILNYPEYNDVERAKKFLQLISEKDSLNSLITSDDLNVKIGDENEIIDAKELSVISSKYSLNGVSGKVGLIGPTRINYGKVISVLKIITNELTEMLKTLK
ncbi:MAG: heat-inducible transcriptional repressor HrcA [Oscillospiraceae bacterium]|nr:heat-inducible transcriptional repressor HrcA [Oscillospiraceae bacterium]